MIVRLIGVVAALTATVLGQHQTKMTMDIDTTKPLGGVKAPEDNIPVIEIKGEGKPMTAAQIRALEEATDGPQDIKVKKTWVPSDAECPRKAQRKDFITFQFKAYKEDGKKFFQSYNNNGPIRIQLGTGMTIPGLDKGMRGMCDTELRNIRVPWRLSRRHKSRTWKVLPLDEHWLVFDIEMLKVEPWTAELQYEYINSNNDTAITHKQCLKHLDDLTRTYGKHTWHNDDIDSVQACTYFIRYFDADGDMRLTRAEYVNKLNEDMADMGGVKRKPKGRKRDPDVGWILDFNNDGVVTFEEMDNAPEILAKTPETPGTQKMKPKEEL